MDSLLARHPPPEGPWLEIACGAGRYLRALATRGRSVCGVDCDPRMVAAAQRLPATADIHCADACSLQLGRRFAVVVIFGHSLTVFHSRRMAAGLFTSIAAHLLPEGLCAIGNCCTPLWDEVAKGNYANGLSADGSEQLFLLRGDNRFVWRRGQAVDPGSWEPKPDDRLYRLWSLGEVALAAAGAGLASSHLVADSPFMLLRRPGI